MLQQSQTTVLQRQDQQQLSLLQQKQLLQQRKAHLLQLYAEALQLQQQQDPHTQAPAVTSETHNNITHNARQPGATTMQFNTAHPASPALSASCSNPAAETALQQAAAAVRYYPARLPNGMLVMVPAIVMRSAMQQLQQQVLPVSSALPKLKVPASTAAVTAGFTSASAGAVQRPATASIPAAKRLKTAEGSARACKIVSSYQDLLQDCDDDVTTEEESDEEPIETPLSLPGLLNIPKDQPGQHLDDVHQVQPRASQGKAVSQAHLRYSSCQAQLRYSSCQARPGNTYVKMAQTSMPGQVKTVDSVVQACTAAACSTSIKASTAKSTQATTAVIDTAEEDREAAATLVQLFRASKQQSKWLDCQQGWADAKQQQQLPRQYTHWQHCVQ